MKTDISPGYFAVVFNRKYPKDSPEEQLRVKQEITIQLARILQANPSDITVVSMVPGSLRTMLKILPPFANLLIDLAEQNDPILKQEGIERVEPINFSPNRHIPAKVSADSTIFSVPDTLVKLITYDRLIGGPLRRFINIPDGHQGLVLYNGEPSPKRLLPGRRVVVGFGDTVWRLPATIEVALIRTTPLIAPLLIQNLIDARGALVGLWAQLEIQVTNPNLFYASLSIESGSFSVYDLIDLLLDKVQTGLSASVRRMKFDADHPQSATDATKGVLDSLLTETANSYGLTIKPAKHLTMWSLETAVVRAKALFKLKEQLVQAYINASIDRAEQFSVMHDIVVQMADDYQLPSDLLATVLEQVSDFKLPPESISAAYIEILDTIATLNVEMQIGRFHPPRHTVNAEAPVKVPAQTPLMQWSRILKLGAGGLLLMVSIYSSFIAPLTVSTKMASVLPLLAQLPITIAMFLIAFRLDEQAGRKRSQWYANHHLTGWRDTDLQTVDRQVRQQLAGALTTVKNNLFDARKTAYDAGNSDLALEFGNTAKNTVEKLISKVQQQTAGVPQYLTAPPHDASQLGAQMDYDEMLLRTAMLVVTLSDEILQNDTGNSTDTQPLIIDIKHQLTRLSTAFDNRAQLIS